MEYLQGGRPDQIVRIGDRVHRPVGPWTKQVHKFLLHLRSEGFFAAPEPFGFDTSGREIVSFIEGEVSNYPLSDNASSTSALISAAKLLRKYHDASQSFLASDGFNQACWQLPCRDPQEVMCHGDFAPYNVVLNGNQAIGIIDFDTVHPGTRLWDIAYALYRWSPFMNPNNSDGFGCIEDQINRARLFCNAYGLPEANRKRLPLLIIERLHSLVNFMLTQVKNGNQTFESYLQDKHHLLYLADIEYIKTNKFRIEEGLKD